MADKSDTVKDGQIAAVAEKALSGLSKDDIKKILTDGSAMSGLSETLAAHINAMGSLFTPKDLDKHQVRRLKALKKLQFESTILEAQFYTEVQALEAKYLVLNQPLFDKRRDILSGTCEPTDEEAHWSEDDDEDDESPDKPDSKETNGGSTAAASSVDAPSTGLNDFWLIALKNCEMMADVITEEDEPALSHLMEIKIVYVDNTGLDFSLEFLFSDNEWFTNKTLSKSYKVTCEASKDDPWSFEGASIIDGKGCSIDWKKGKNLTVKTVKRKPKKGKGSAAKTVTKTVPSESFFNMFSLPSMDSKSDVDDEDDFAQALSSDYTRAEFIRDRLVPKAVLFFTGEALDEDEDDEDYGDDFDDDEDDLEDDYNPEKQVAQAKQADCKNQ